MSNSLYAICYTVYTLYMLQILHMLFLDHEYIPLAEAVNLQQ